MSLCNLLRQKHTLSQIFRHLSGDQITLRTCYIRIFIGVFLHNIFIAVLDQTHNGVIRRIGFTNQFSCITINNILLRKNKLSCCHKLLLNNILNVFYLHRIPFHVFNAGNNTIDHVIWHFFKRIHFCIGLSNGN